MPKADNKEPEIYPDKRPPVLSMDVYMQIVRHWNQPFLLQKKDGGLYERFVEFGQPDTEIDGLLKEEKIVSSGLNGLGV